MATIWVIRVIHFPGVDMESGRVLEEIEMSHESSVPRWKGGSAGGNQIREQKEGGNDCVIVSRPRTAQQSVSHAALP
jgi:hypothetical protein